MFGKVNGKKHVRIFRVLLSSVTSSTVDFMMLANRMAGRFHSCVNMTNALFRHLSCPASPTTSKPGSCMPIGLGPSNNSCRYDCLI